MLFKITVASRKHFTKRLLPTVLFITASLISNTAFAEKLNGLSDPNNHEQVQRGLKAYMRFCSLCHGKNLEGQPNWRVRKPNGKLPAPPHDETGHTWHHSDIVLFEITKFGLIPPNAPEGYKSDMPAWKDTLSDSDIWAVLSFIKSRWPEETRKYQQQFNIAK
ncbi:MAG: cytochrome c [Gammaproteobacteria bacterium]|nr:cytochrome c [Gammaproteobacteria bacterium]MDH5802727.1 cytochrome c [Gammaproteobacteria bacterium]